MKLPALPSISGKRFILYILSSSRNRATVPVIHVVSRPAAVCPPLGGSGRRSNLVVVPLPPDLRHPNVPRPRLPVEGVVLDGVLRAARGRVAPGGAPTGGEAKLDSVAAVRRGTCAPASTPR